MRSGDVARDVAQDLLREALRLVIELADQPEVAAHLVERAHRIARRDRLVDAGVIAHRKMVRVGHVDGRRALVDQPLHQDLVHGREDRVPGDGVELVVEGDVGADEFRDVADRGDVRVERPLQPRDVLVRRDLRGLPCDARLEKQPRLLHLCLALRGRGDALDEAGELADEQAVGGRGDARARAAGDVDETLLLQQEQRLAHRRPPDAETLRQHFLGRKLAADLELAAGDGLFEKLGDLMRALAAADRSGLDAVCILLLTAGAAAESRSRPLAEQRGAQIHRDR